ncbi:MAG: serine hydrolase [Nocardioides sp.]
MESDLIGIWQGALDGTTWWEQDADEPAYSASLMKVPVATAAERRHQRGEIDLDALVEIHTDFDSELPGERYVLDRDDDQDDATWDHVGEQVTLRELRRRAIVVSGNLATNLLLEPTGVAEVSAVLAEAGVSGRTRITRGIDDGPARDAGYDNVVTARDLGRLLAQTPSEVEHVMLGQTHRDAIPAGMPAGTAIANKTGWIDDHTHDMALVRPTDSEPFALVLLTRLAGVGYDDANTLLARLAAQAWERRR